MHVPSFNIDHDKLNRGVYVSRIDYVGEYPLTSFDIRIKRPNIEPPIDFAALHTLEHFFAVFLRNPENKIAEDVIYVGPMGCRTGMYLVLKGDKKPKEIIETLKEICKYIITFEGEVPASTSKECGNYKEHNLNFAKYEARKYLEEVLEVIKEENMIYP